MNANPRESFLAMAAIRSVRETHRSVGRGAFHAPYNLLATALGLAVLVGLTGCEPTPPAKTPPTVVETPPRHHRRLPR